MPEKKLNLDIADRVSELEAMMNRFPLKWIIYKRIFRGKGLEFDGYRGYSPDDDASMIDWMATSRSNETLVKKYIEERDFKIMFFIDTSDSMIFGSCEKLKCEYAAEIAASLSHLIISSGDHIGFGFFNEHLKKIVPPSGGERRFNIFTHELENIENYGGKPSDLDKTFEFLIDYVSDSVNAVFFISDFLNLGSNFLKNFEIFSSKFETIPIIIRDKLDETLPIMDCEVIIENPSSGKQLLVNPAVARKEYEKRAKDKKQKLLKIFEDCGVESLEIKTNEPFLEYLVEFLNERAKHRKVAASK